MTLTTAPPSRHHIVVAQVLVICLLLPIFGIPKRSG